MDARNKRILHYLYAVLTVSVALGIRLILLPLTGTGAPFVLFFAAVLVSSFLWGVGPGFFASVLSTPTAAYLFIHEAHYTVSQAVSQSVIFFLETTMICILAARFSKAIRRAEINERAARKALKDRQIFGALIENSFDFISIADKDGKVVYINPAGRKLVGLAHDHPIQGTPLLDYYSSEQRSVVSEVISKSLEKSGHWRGETFLRNWETHQNIPVSDTHFVIHDFKTGEALGMGTISRDITKLKELQRMREEWTSVIAHDLRQPIGVIAMGADLLPKLHRGLLDEREKAIDERIRSAAGSLSRMVDDLLDISRIEASRLVLVKTWQDPRILVKESMERLSHLTAGFRLHLEEECDLLPVFVDRMRIEQVIGNLLSNAVKYGREGSEIRVRLRLLGDFVEVSVTNEGQGIPENELPVLFSRFWRSKTIRESGVPGLGLGLYISKGLIEAHGGQISVHSVPEKTTTFCFTLPTRTFSEKEAA